MIINETTNFNANVMVPDANGADTVVMYLNSTLDGGTMNVNISANTVNKSLAISNAASVKAQYEEFRIAVANRAIELGYVIF